MSAPIPAEKPVKFAKSISVPIPKGKPERTFSSRHFASKDLQALEKAINYLERGLWSKARQSAKTSAEPAVLTYVDWQYHQEAGNKAPFEAIRLFLDKNPSWPREGKLLALAESRLPDAMPARQKLDWFEKRPPVSGHGKMKMGEALLASGEKTKGEAMIINAWINGNFSKKDAQLYYKRHKKRLKEDHHIARLDRLVWDGKTWPAKRMYSLVPKSWQRLAEARIALRIRAGNVDSLISRVPRELKDDPGLIYERVRWRRKKRKLESALDLLLTVAGNNLPRPEKWWVEKRILLRWALEEGRITDARKLTDNHGMTRGGPFAEAEFLAGWLALEFLAEPHKAYKHFETLDASVSRPVSKARAAYWAARAARAMGDEKAVRSWATAATAFPTTYYGQLALQHYGGTNQPNSPFMEGMKQAPSKSFTDPRLTILNMLAVLDEKRRARRFIDQLAKSYEEAGEFHHAVALLDEANQTSLALRMSKRAGWKHHHMAETAFPLAPLPRESRGLDMPEHAFILSVMRQESAFDDSARSHAGARGLMQMMPATAKLTAKAIGMPYSRSRLTDPDYNAQLGAAHLAQLLEKYNGSYIMTLAAYNAGSSRVTRWVKRFGDPRDDHIDAVNWVERIPFTETRNYVQRIMENLQIYRHRLTEEDPTDNMRLALAEDLKRGYTGESIQVAVPRANPCNEALAQGLSAGESGTKLPYKSRPADCQ